MLMTLWPITAPLMDPSALENPPHPPPHLPRRTSERLFGASGLCQVIYGRTLSPLIQCVAQKKGETLMALRG